MSLFKDRVEFPLMALEVQLFISTPKVDVHALKPLVNQLQNLLHSETESPTWARSQFHELNAEIAKRRNMERKSAQELLSAWALNKENTYLLAEAAEMYSRFGMIRTAKRTYEQYLNTKFARTGILDRSIQIRLQHKNLLLKGSSAVDDFVAVAYNDNTIMEAAERILEVGRAETCKVLLDRVSRQTKKTVKYKLIALKHAKLSHHYDRAVTFAHQILQKKTTAGLYDNKALEAFFEACLVADKEFQAIKWCEEQKIQPATMAVFPRALLSLMIYKETQDRTYWNRIFYTSELTSNLEAFRKESEKNGLETTLQRIKLRRYHMVRDTDGVNRVISEMKHRKKPPFDVALEIADTLADLNEADQAIALYEDLLREHPDSALVLNNYGFFLCSSPNRIREAETLIRRALLIDPDNPAYCDSLSWLLFLKGQVPEAKKILESCLKPDSLDSVMLDHMGDICHALGDESNALNYWSRALKLRPPSFFDILNKLDPP
jgi:tetratricopeptide (TPR) repeat protein